MGLKLSSIYFFSASLNHAFFFGVFNPLPVTLRSRLERNSIPKENCHSPTSRVSVFPYNLISREGYFSVSYFRTQPSFGKCEDIQIIGFEDVETWKILKPRIVGRLVDRVTVGPGFKDTSLDKQIIIIA